MFFAGSTTKSFTAAAAAQLIESNATDSYGHQVSWTTRLSDLIRDDFVLTDEYATSHITIEDALSHRTGMPRHDISWINGNPSVREQVRQLRYLPLHNELRTTWEYCNLMFTSISHAVETVLKRPMSAIFGDIWKSIGMNETVYNLDEAIILADEIDTTVARAYLYNNATKSQVLTYWSDVPPANGAGGIISNVLDYTKWLHFLMHADSESGPISVNSVKAMTSPHMIMPGDWRPYKGQYYGFGLEGGIYRDHLVLEHSGGIAGYMANMLWLPELEWGIVTMQNTYSFAQSVIAYALVDDFLGLKDKDRFNAAAAVKKIEAEKMDKLQHDAIRKRLWPDAPSEPLAPSLPLEAYEGTYHHPAYQNISIFLLSHDQTEEESLQPSYREDQRDERLLHFLPMPGSYLSLSGTFHHVSGEHWYAHMVMGQSWITDEVMKAEFRVGYDGKVAGLKLQAEPSMDELSWFRKVD